MRSDDEIAFVIDHYRLPIPAAARRLILERARLAEEGRVRSQMPAPAGAAAAGLDQPIGHGSEPPRGGRGRGTPAE